MDTNKIRGFHRDIRVILVAHLVTGNGARAAAILAVPVFVTALGLTRLLAGALESAGFASLRPLLLLQLLLLSGFFVLCASAGAGYCRGHARRLGDVRAKRTRTDIVERSVVNGGQDDRHHARRDGYQ